jgi:dipicolinate synthase subunit A
MNGAIIKDDARYDHCENYLKKRGYTFSPNEKINFVIFPFLGAVDISKYDDGFFSGLEKGTPVFSGVSNKTLVLICEKYELDYHAMIENKGVAIKNAVPTSEGVLAYLIANRNETVANSRVLVIGYGICGSDLCRRLVRNREKESSAYTDGITPLYLPDIFENKTFDIIINTVPERVLSNKMLSQTNGAILIDIASSPYGFDIAHAKKLNEKSAVLPGLPGKFAAKTAGEILGDYVNYILSGGN